MAQNLVSSMLSRQSQPNNPRILCDLITNLSETKSKQQILQQLNKVDEQLYMLYGGSNSGNQKNMNISQNLAQSPTINNTTLSFGETSGILAASFNNTNSVSLGVPKNNSLTDSFLRSTLGCQEKLAKSYLQILDQTDLTQEQQKQKRIQQAKKRFQQANNYKDTYANCKPYMDKTITKSYLKKAQPVVDNQHDSYLKTQLIYLQKPISGSKKMSQKQYYDKHSQNVVKKINQIGGMQDTVGNMQDSLSKNQIKNFNKRSQFVSSSPNNTLLRNNSRSIGKKTMGKDTGNSWVDRSKSIREALISKFNVQQS